MPAVVVVVAKVFQFNRVDTTYKKRFHFMEPFLRFKRFVFHKIRHLDRNACSGEIYPDRFSHIEQSWFSTSLHSNRNDDIEVGPIEINTALKLLKSQFVFLNQKAL